MGAVAVALNEAIELDKTFDEPRARAFVNGVLNGVKEELEAAPDAAGTAEEPKDGEA